MTALMVSHDAAEIARLADLVLVMEAGTIVRRETAAEFAADATLRFEGLVIAVEHAGARWVVTIEIAGTRQRLALSEAQARALKAGDRVRLGARVDNPLIDKL